MDRLQQLRGEVGGSGDSTLDTTSPPSEAYMSVNESSKYFSLIDSTFDVSSIKDSLASTSTASDRTIPGADELMPNLSPRGKNDLLDTYKIGNQIEAANILSGGVEIFDDNDNSFDGNELVIDDNIEVEDKLSADKAEAGCIGNIPEPETPVVEAEVSAASKLKLESSVVEGEVSVADELILEPPVVVPEGNEAHEEINVPNVEGEEILVPDRERDVPNVVEEILVPDREIDVPDVVEAEILVPQGGTDEPNMVEEEILAPNGEANDPPVIEAEVPRLMEAEVPPVMEAEVPPVMEAEVPPVMEAEVPPVMEAEVGVPSREMEVVLQIDGNNVDAIDIGNGLYLYRKDGQQELAAIQIIGDDPHRTVKYLKVRDNAQGNLEVYEEIEIEVTKEVPIKENKPTPEPKDIKAISTTNKIVDRQNQSPLIEPVASTSGTQVVSKDRETSAKSKSEVDQNGKMMKNTESQKLPVVGSFTPMPFHSTPIKEGKPLTKTMVDRQLHPNRHSDNVKKTIEVHTDSIKQKSKEPLAKGKGPFKNVKTNNPNLVKKSIEYGNKLKPDEKDVKNIINSQNKQNLSADVKANEGVEKASKIVINADKDELAPKLKNTTYQPSDVQNSSNSAIKPNQEEDIILRTPSIDNKGIETAKVNPRNITIPELSNTNTQNTKLVQNKCSEEEKGDLNKIEFMNDKKEFQRGKDQNSSINETKEVKKNYSFGKEEADAALKSASGSSSLMPHMPSDAKVKISIQNEDDMEKFFAVSSTSSNHDAEKSKVETITLYAMDSFESVPSSRVTKEENEESNKSKAVVKQMSNLGNIAIVKQKDNMFLHKLKESYGEDQVDSTSKIADEVSCLSTCAQVAKDVESNNSQKFNNTSEIIEQPKSVSKVEVAENDALSMQKTKLSQREMCVVVPELKPSGKEAHTSPVLEMKTLDKATSVLPVRDLKLLDKAPNALSTPLKKPAPSITQKTKELAAVKEIKPSVNVSHAAHFIEVKPQGALTQPVSVTDVNAIHKTGHSIPVPKAKTLEKATSSSECSLNMIHVKPKSAGHIPVAANIANKPSSKHITIKILKNEEVKKASSIQKEVMVKNSVEDKNVPLNLIESRDIKEPINKIIPEPKPVNNNHTAAVPFGKWTDVNRQEFLNKFKEVKIPVHTNTKQIKNSNDLNRRDILKKIDSQRAQTIINNATAKAQEKLNVKSETVFSSKVLPPKVDTKVLVKSEVVDIKPVLAPVKVATKQENPQEATVLSKLAPKNENLHKTAVTSTSTVEVETDAVVGKTDLAQRADLSTATMASLIDKTIEGMINRVIPCKNDADELKEATKINAHDTDSSAQTILPQISKPAVVDSAVTLDDIEMKMNELHGIPFVERPPHELPKVLKPEIKTYSKIEKDKTLSKVTKIPNTISSTTEPQIGKDNVIDLDSEEEVIEHEPITGDIELSKKNIPSKLPIPDKKSISEKSAVSTGSKDVCNREGIITETDFDKFARRNSITYENCLTVNFEHKEHHKAVVQTVKEKELALKVNPKNETYRINDKSNLPHKQALRHNIQPGNTQSTTKFSAVSGDSSNKNYHSKIHSAYQSLTAKHQASAITMIEDKPVKVLFVESNTGFVPSQLNVQGKELSPVKKLGTELDISTSAKTESVDSDMLEAVDENKQDKVKTKHQRKQVLTPVEEPDLELIQPSDIGVDLSPKKKRKIDDTKADKQLKNLVHKKSYLLGRNTITDDKTVKTQNLTNDVPKEIIIRNDNAPERKDTASAIDSLVKAAELLDYQTENINSKSITQPLDSPTNTPVKRGRGRPRKYPLPEGATINKTPSPQKIPRLIDAKLAKEDSISDEHDFDTSEDDEMVRENWTMGKINENIVCPICNKLFRSENVVFKHVKHCTGVSPNRSESDKQSPRRGRLSQESESISDMDYEIPVSELKKSPPKKRKSKDCTKTETKPEINEPEAGNNDVLVIKDTPIKEKPEKRDKEKEDKKKEDESQNDTKLIVTHQPSNNLVCEFCGKKFRQLSYLVSHKLQHKKEQIKKVGKDTQISNKLQVFSCEVCKKEFRKLHHLVQHRNIHNPVSVAKRTLRNSASDQSDTKNFKEAAAQPNDDPSAGFRCEPCDKSFRKLHHLVEHRETHDGINRQKPAVTQPIVEKPTLPPQCDICKKTFRKLHHLVEHKEQHADTSSEKSDDKSVKSSLSTKDIIHECSLCYMVFPNEHSLNKHSVICSRKKRQSKQPIENSENESNKYDENMKSEEKKDEMDVIVIPETVDVARGPIDDKEKVANEQDNKNLKVPTESEKLVHVEKPFITEINKTDVNIIPVNEVTEKPLQKELEVKSPQTQVAPAKGDLAKSDESKVNETSVVQEKIKKIDNQVEKIQDTPKRKTLVKDNVALTVRKRQKTIDVPVTVADEIKPSLESSDDDEVRYMLNPNFNVNETSEAKIFMKVNAKKRNSLQIERPNSKDLVKRRTSVQHPPKTQRVKPEPVERRLKVTELKPKAPETKRKSADTKTKLIESKTRAVPQLTKLSEAEAHSTDSDDSDVKYSFPIKAPEISRPAQEVTLKETVKIQRKYLMEKRKSLGSIAKRKSLGKAITVKHKVKDTLPKIVKKRTMEVEHRCDCGELFSSAALLSRHTSLAHTPPRIRRRRVPSPEPAKPLRTKTGPASSQPDKAKRKSSVKSEASDSKPNVATKSSVKNDASDSKPNIVTKSSIKSSNSKPSVATKSNVKNNASDSKPSLATKSNVKNDASDSKHSVTMKSSVKSDANDSKPSVATRKSSVRNEAKTPTVTRKSIKPKSAVATAAAKTRRSMAHAGVPVPEKMRKIMESNKK